MDNSIKIKEPNLKIHNKYKLQLFDEGGQLIQEAFAYNQASSRKYNMMCLNGSFPEESYNNRSYVYNGPSYVALGTGTGTIDIDSTFSLFKKVFYSSITWNKISDYIFENMHFTSSVSFPATTSYVGELTEIGLGTGYYGDNLFSHALLVDVEGNPIIVSKTSTNILVVTIDMFFTAIMPDQPLGFLYNPPESSALTGAWRSNWSYPSSSKILPVPGGKSFYFSPAYCPNSNDGKIANNCSYNPSSDLHSSGTWKTTELSSSTASSYPYKMEALNCRSDADKNNFGFAHSIVFPGFGTIPLPNEDIIPAYSYNDIVIGTGDGTTLNWLPSVNEVVSAEIYVNGILSDATFQNFDPTQSPLWNKAVKVEYIRGSSTLETKDIPCVSNSDYQAYCLPLPMSSAVAAMMSNGVKALQNCTPSTYHSADSYSAETLGTNIIYYDENGITLDHFRISKYRNGYDDYSAYSCSLQYSNNGTDWTEAIQASDAYTIYYFDAVTAKYWRIIGGTNAGRSSSTAYGFAIVPEEEEYNKIGYDQKAIIAGNSAVFDFGKCGVNFTAPPAEGDVITMNAVLNLPYKNNNTILIASYEAEVSDPGEAM